MYQSSTDMYVHLSLVQQISCNPVYKCISNKERNIFMVTRNRGEMYNTGFIAAEDYVCFVFL